MNTTSIQAVACMLLIGNIACGGSQAADPRQQLLDQKLQQWSESNIDDYQFVYRTIRFAPPEEDVVVVVLDHRVSQAFYTPSGVIISGDRLQQVVTFDGLFAIVQDAINRNADSLEVGYNSDYGYPQTILIDYDKTIADEEVAYLVIDF